MAAADQELPQPLKYQTLALKVSIHCEGCKREVKRVLHHIEGVYKVSFDSEQHKVVVNGNVAAETLIKKLNKTGKHAELWPEEKPAENSGGGGGGGGGGGSGSGGKKSKKKKNKNKNKSTDGKADEPPENPENNLASSGDDSSAETPDKPDGEAPKNDGKDPAHAPEKQDGTEKVAANAGGGTKKKKKKKGHNEQSNNNNNNKGGGGGGNPGGAEVEVAAQEGGKKAAGGSGGLAIPPAPSFPMYNNTSQLPSYVVSYSSVQPSVSYGGAFHPMPMKQSSYIYSTASPGSYYIFSEENANACSIM